MKILEWLKEKLMTYNDKKIYTNLIVLLCMGITFVIVANFYRDISLKSKGDFEKSLKNSDYDDVSEYNSNKDDFEKDMEKHLSEILSKIDNVGKVSIMITYKTGKELITDKDNSINDKITDEKDTEGGTRVINESSINDKTVMVNEQGGGSKPVVVKEINPEIKGVIVVAEGAKDSKVKQKLSKAVQTVFDIPAYRVIVLETK
jgi:stage III sporulation protein AG